MPNILSYVEEIQALSFYDAAPSAVDFLVLSELGYLPYDGVLGPAFDLKQSLRLEDLAAAYFQAKGDKPLSAAACKNRIQLLKKVRSAKRYKNIKVFAYADEYAPREEKQFSALIFRLMTGTFLLAFRGTDDSLIGWKESFHMTYKTEVPSQTAAKIYLERALEKLPGQFHLAGHSKGGSLCLFSASKLAPNLQDRIASITTYDAPGLHQEIRESAGYQAIQSRICSLVPQDSVVGQLLGNTDPDLVVKSCLPGLLQHDVYTWQIRNGQFVRLKRVTRGSRQVNRALTIWLEETHNRDLQRSFDASFNLLFATGFSYLGDFKRLTPRRMWGLLREVRRMPNTDKAMVIRLIRQFFFTYLQIVREGIPLEDWLTRVKRRLSPGKRAS